MKYCFLRFPEGKFKAVTLSYDDGNLSDLRFVETLNGYGIKCTFNISAYIVSRESDRNLSVEQINEKLLAAGHEVAVHGQKHAALGLTSPVECTKEVLYGRLGLERALGRIIRGMAYPDTMKNLSGEVYDRVKSTLKSLGIVYARSGAQDNDTFDLPLDWHMWIPTAHHDNPRLYDYLDRFLSLDEAKLYVASKTPKLFYVWGHSFEFDRKNNWERLSEICERLGGREDIWYATNMEIYDYVKAYESLIFNAAGTKVYNPTLVKVWFWADGKQYSVAPGETVSIG